MIKEFDLTAHIAFRTWGVPDVLYAPDLLMNWHQVPCNDSSPHVKDKEQPKAPLVYAVENLDKTTLIYEATRDLIQSIRKGYFSDSRLAGMHIARIKDIMEGNDV